MTLLLAALLLAAPATGQQSGKVGEASLDASTATPPPPAQVGAPGPALQPADPSEADFDADLDAWLDDVPDPAERDALEGYNRHIFAFNEKLYRHVITPVTEGFRFLVPQVGRRAIRSVFGNLELPVIFVNDVLQLAPREAATTFGRFVMNTTFGLGGLLDPASDVGWKRHDTDFGQTLAVYGVPSGSYFVVPVAGPFTLRDGLGNVVDIALRPDMWLLGFGPWVLMDVAGGVATFDVEEQRLDALRATSVDFYAALRAAYLMDRDASVAQRIQLVRGVSEHESGSSPLEAAVLGFLTK
jgi:Surface lipoprotein